MAKEKLTKKIIEQAVELKSSGLSDCDIAAALQVHPGTLSRWINHPETKLQRTLSVELKKTESAYKEQLLQTIRAAAMAKNANWTAAAWLLERKYPDEFSQNRQPAPPFLSEICCRGLVSYVLSQIDIEGGSNGGRR